MALPLLKRSSSHSVSRLALLLLGLTHISRAAVLQDGLQLVGRGDKPGSLGIQPAKALPSTEQQQLADHCKSNEYAGLFNTLDMQLRHWQEQGISTQLMDDALAEKDEPPYRWGKRVGVLMEGGVPYIISNLTYVRASKHHRPLITAYLMVMVGLSRLFGSQLPDVEFVIGTGDDPTALLSKYLAGQQPPPLFKFCTTPAHADILIPYIHFAMRDYQSTRLAQIGRLNTKYPWDKKRRKLFGRFSPYRRFHKLGNNATAKLGVGGVELCTHDSPNTLSCPVRQHIMTWVEEQNNKNGSIKMDVAQQPRVDMDRHAKYRYLLHLDGQTCSSRLEQLLALGSLVIKEESGYQAFYHHLLQPGVHYVPFWKKVPEEVLDVLSWAGEHDEEAQAISRRGQDLVSQVLSNRAQACYWYHLLHRFSQLLKYKPGTAGRRNYSEYLKVEDWLSKYHGSRLRHMFHLHVNLA